jgi:glyoxylase-like metal-dependent hydrolase (beta-lactamase superfamily II)
MNRREFVSRSGAFLGVAGTGNVPFLLNLGRDGRYALASARGHLEPITEHVSLYRDVVNVGVIRKNGKTLLIDSGDASILELAKVLNLGTVDQVLFTHYHRDQCSGAARLKEAGAKIGVPASEAQFFDHATEFWLSANNTLYERMDFRPEMMVLRESVAVDHGIKPGDVLDWEGISIRAVATPGHTEGSLTYLVESDGKTIAFSGDLISGPGQIWEIYSLQKRFPEMRGGYWGFGGASSQLLESANTLLTYKPTELIPSHGEIIHDPNSAVASLQGHLESVMKNFLTLSAWRISPSHKKEAALIQGIPMLPPLPKVSLPSWLHKVEGAGTSYCIIADDKTSFLFDCGYAEVVPALDRMVKSGEISGIDAIWATHYHDDHTTSINAVRRIYGAKVYAQEEMRDILENPIAYSMPALYSESIHIDHVLTEGEVIQWMGYKLTAYYFPGQTLYHDGLLIEYQGARVFMSGDSFANWGIDDYCSYNRNFIGKDGDTAGYNRCLRLLMQLKPDILVAAHWGPEPVSQEYLQKTLDLLHEREKLLAPLFPWDDANFGLDPYWIRVYPYRQNILPGQRVALEARIFNHSDSPRTASAELRAPEGWRVESGGSVTIPPHTEGSIRLNAVATDRPPQHRQVLGLAVHFDGRNLGEFAEAIVDYLT